MRRYKLYLCGKHIAHPERRFYFRHEKCQSGRHALFCRRDISSSLRRKRKEHDRIEKFRNRICPDCFLRERPRKGDHRLSISGAHLFELVRRSDLIDKGSNIGYEYSGKAPDLGPFEYSAAESSSTEETTRVVKRNPSSLRLKSTRRFDALGKAIRKAGKKVLFLH